ncbi:MAG: diaminopimelate epimerase [Oscillospiraceae bacterium]|nr:diaminopimelate epimerase [Oscillospiraceae bacterium]
MRFTKMQGAGNDFIIIDIDKEKISPDALPDIAKRVCSRRLSVGADGLMAVTSAENGGDYRMLFYNSDGTEGEMCGNGARCIARYGYENGLAGEIQHIETVSGTVVGKRISERKYQVRMNDPTVIDLSRAAENIECSYIELGDPGLPHAVAEMYFEELPEDELRELGRKLRWNSVFPKGANVNFCRIIGDDHVIAKTFERGVEDFTLACGTGASSVVTALTLMGKVSGKNVKVDMPGGKLEVSLTVAGETVRDIFLTGPTNIVAVGEITDEDM